MAMSSDGTDANRTVFVGNLDPLVKEEILYELFLQAGPVRRVTMARDREGRRRPFGFVLYKHAEAVPYAIALLNGICLYGRPLKLGFSTGSSQDTWGSFGSPGTEDRGPNAVRRGVCPQDSPIFNFSGFIPHGDCRPQDQISWRSNVCNWPPCQLPPLTPLPHQVAPHPFPGFFNSTPLQPWPGPVGGFWTPPLTPLPPPAPPPPQEREREEPPPPPPPKEREMERERDREKLPVPPKEQATEQEKEREKEMKRHKHKRMRNRKHRHQSRHKT
ncbi:RNA binding motif protein 11 [Clupea harengus]|uniref:RNA binding motif protein 11 n=1 Tax=Clupea harengus TaxID=7950 RepID=A0A6P8FAC6_CLUHA|nr:RNA binding motif protein 11 [Clupea harengus]